MANLISIGQIIDRTWEVYSANFKPLMKISLWGFLIGLFVVLRLVLLPDGETETIAQIIGGNPQQATIIGFAIAAGISLFAIPVTSIWIYMNLVRASDAHLNKRSYDLKELSRQSWRDFLPYLWVMILKTVASVAPMFLIVPGTVLLVMALFWSGIILNALGLILTFVGVVAALILVIWLGVRLAFTGYAMLLDNINGVSAVRESFRLTNGAFWGSLWRLLIPKLVFGAGVLIVEIILGLLIPLLVTSFYQLGETFGLYASLIVTVALTTGLRVLYPPLFIIADQLLYGSLKQSRR